MDSLTSQTDYRRSLAIHFHRLTRISRHDLFGEADSQLRPKNLPTDNETMFAGFVGSKYVCGKGLLLLGINPGGGGDSYAKRISEDEVFYPRLHAFKSANDDSILEHFENINESFVRIVKGWKLWRIFKPTLIAAALDLDDVAYMNIVPYRTRANKMPPIAARRTSWDKIVAPTSEVLCPRAIIALGKKAGSVVNAFMDADLPVYCVPRTIGDSYISKQADEVHDVMRKELRDG